MAHGKKTGNEAVLATAPTPMEPQAHIAWPHEGVQLSGDHKALGMGKRARIILEGEIRGYSMRESGCDVDLKVKMVRVDGVGGTKGGDDGESMSAMIDKMKPKRKYDEE